MNVSLLFWTHQNTYEINIYQRVKDALIVSPQIVGYIYYEIIDNNNHKIIKISFYIVDNLNLVKFIPYVRQFYTKS